MNQILFMLLVVTGMAVYAYVWYKVGQADAAPAPEPVDWGSPDSYPAQDGVVFGRYCLM